jgi:post-segregation antitoxin (ccd killing protein)
LSDYVTVSVKVPRRLRDRMRELDVEWGRVLRAAIEREVERAERARAVDAILELAERAPRTGNIVVEVIREIRRGFE